MPYASITGTPNASSRSSCTRGGSGAEDDRTKRRDGDARRFRASTAWCMVGTAVYQVGSSSDSQPWNDGAWKPGVQMTLAPAESEERSAATRPWMWKSGITLRQRSPGVSSSVAATLPADSVSRRWVSGTIFGRAVVPDVWRTSAVSSSRASSALPRPPRTGRPGAARRPPWRRRRCGAAVSWRDHATASRRPQRARSLSRGDRRGRSRTPTGGTSG